jgi:hypothetical protein
LEDDVDDVNEDALAEVLAELAQLATDHPRARSVLIRLLRSVRDAITDLLEDDQAGAG